MFEVGVRIKMPKRRFNSMSTAEFARRKRAKRSKNMFYKKRKYKRTGFAKAVMSVVNRKAEVKEAYRQIAVNVALDHNQLNNLDSNVFYTTNGLSGEATGGTQNARVGGKIFVKGIKVALMIESMQMRPQVNYWLYLVRRKDKVDDAIITKDDMFEGLSTTIPMDYIDTERVHVLYCKKIVIKMPNQGTAKDMQAPQGWANLAESDGISKATITNPQKIVKFYVPINKTVPYVDHTDVLGRPVPTWHYQWVMISYDNYVTNAGGAGATPTGHVHMTQVLKFTDV